MKLGLSATFALGLGAPPGEMGAYACRLASLCEEAGLDSIWFADRTVYPADLAERYPDRWGPGKMDPKGQNVLEPVTTLSFVASQTSRITLGFSVLILPLRHPVLNAKMVTTLDVLSGGRVVFGAGLGWMPEEFEGMGADYRTRGRVTDESIEMFKALCTEETASYSGRHFSISGKSFYPKPLQKPHPPIWIGGGSKAAMRRAARLGDVWFPMTLDADSLVAQAAALRRMCEENGREPGSVGVAMGFSLELGRPRTDAVMSGSSAEVRDDLRRYRDAGVEHAIFSIPSQDWSYTEDSIRRLAGEIGSSV